MVIFDLKKLKTKNNKESIMKRLLTIMTIFSIIFVSGINLFPLMVANNSDKGYDRGGDGVNMSANGSAQIRTLIIEAAGQYIKSHSDFQLFLDKIEMAELYGVNFDELRYILNNAISSMESAKATYFELKTVAAATPYNPDVIYLLKNFDYNGFQEENGLTQEIFSMVTGYLSAGDITGTYIKMHSNTVSLLNNLYIIKQDIDESNFPKRKDLWGTAQMYSNSQFFGMYISQVFYEVI